MPGTLAQAIQYGKEEKPFIEAHAASNGLALKKSRKSREIEGNRGKSRGSSRAWMAQTPMEATVSARFSDSHFNNPAGVGRISQQPSHAMQVEGASAPGCKG
ncbi:hypothetical protein I7I51_08604 [Histoplasma capsulatum]|uniref:Uncharacterized protein n=1 Tax=Ajellomyces capsulatus TaxID=5037 RepID=A0A8A1M3Z7_AJECA|nr:hypothetical protein I7I51_08604 [Histoplasma capsulatum]